MEAIKKAVIPLIKRRRIAGHDIVLNVSFKDSLIRFGIMLLLPVLMLIIDRHLVIYTAPVIAYLFITAITHFCWVKYIWRRYVKHDPPPVLPDYGKDPNYPAESL